MRALEHKHQGWKQRDIATALGVTEGAVSQWLAAARAGGPAALRSRPVPGAPARLTATQRDLLPELLWHCAESYGFRGEVWTCTRVAHVISSQFGVAYSKSQVSRLLAALNWTPQLPIERAIQRDAAAIAHWRVAVWPALHAQAQQERRALVFVDEAGFYLLAGVVKTYAPSGQTPVLAAWQTRDHLSVMGGLTPTGQIYMLVREEALTGLETIVFLQHLLRHAGERLLVIWDGSPIHWRAEVQDFVSSLGGQRIVLERLPGYAPDLNPWDAGAWQHLKHVELGNVGRLNLAALHLELDLAIGRVRQKPELIQSFFHAAGLVL
jgi:transposase